MSFLDLPRECIDNIISYCDDDEKSALAQTCKIFNTIINEIKNNSIYFQIQCGATQYYSRYYKNSCGEMFKIPRKNGKNFITIQNGCIDDAITLIENNCKINSPKIIYIPYCYFVYPHIYLDENHHNYNTLLNNIKQANHYISNLKLIQYLNKFKHMYVYGIEVNNIPHSYKHFLHYLNNEIKNLDNIEILTIKNMELNHQFALPKNIKILNIIESTIYPHLFNTKQLKNLEKIYITKNTKICGNLILSQNTNLKECVITKRLQKQIILPQYSINIKYY